jgi:ElaB/YqjD/DUF883 family membrane-anchored ribosome-binding protein
MQVNARDRHAPKLIGKRPEMPMNDAAAPSSAAADLARDLRAVVRDAEALLAQAADRAGTDYDAARERLETTLRNARSQLDAADAAVRAKARHAAETADDYVRDHAWQAVGVSAAVGVLLGLLIGRR